MGRRGYLSSFGASAAFAAAAALALLLASLYVTFSGWPGMRVVESNVRTAKLFQEAEAGQHSRGLRLPSARASVRDRREARGARRRDEAVDDGGHRLRRQRVKGAYGEGVEPVAVAARPSAPPAAPPTSTAAPEGDAVAGLLAGARDATEPAGPIVHPVIDSAEDAVDEARDIVGGTVLP